MTQRKESNQEKGRKALEALQDWLDRADVVPALNGKANISAIAVATGLDRQVMYRDDAKAIVAAAVAAKGLQLPGQVRTTGDDLPNWAKDKISTLEARCAVLYAEVGELRRKLKRHDVIEQHMTRTGMIPR